MSAPDNSARPQLLFVYNADSGLFNTLTDIAHKVFSPDTYACDLCALTHGYLTERQEWREVIEALDADCEFLHRDQVSTMAELSGDRFPAVYRGTGHGWSRCLGPDDIAACPGLGELAARLRVACLD